MTNLKSKEDILSVLDGKVFILNCHGCKEVRFPEEEAKELQKELTEAGRVTGALTTDYICNPDNLQVRLRSRMNEIAEADTVLVLSCGVGVQTVADLLEDKRVIAACDTIELPGFQGVTPLEYDCGQCGECFLNLTGGICPITACSKSLVNGPCGGTKCGKCEVDPGMECGWERIYRKLEKLGRLDLMRCPTQLHNWTTDDATKECKETDN
ncbi:MAG: methylenetetrahydrofolate reductase C-terminal domain-containing protein [Oscillospiraceae bacterium]|nr:methylenetetrahydrofolate reductase C-terminal domain-containing protein [Oscillospiraceae bacterium]